jgi:nitrogen fixation/metabolism regulation signal transduction histidine kinase
MLARFCQLRAPGAFAVALLATLAFAGQAAALSFVLTAEFDGVDMVQIKVEDNGPGFQAGAVSQIFDPYVTTKPKGTGLGLAIVKKLVEEHIGSIRARNRTDGGAMISVRLPLNEAARELLIAKAPGRVDQRREQA